MTTPKQTTPQRRKHFWQSPWFKPVLGVLIILSLLVVDDAIGFATSGGKISPEIDRSAERVDVVVDIKFEPRQYHQNTLADLGVFSGRDREDRSKFRFRSVTQGDLDQMARFFWVDEIIPFVR